MELRKSRTGFEDVQSMCSHVSIRMSLCGFKSMVAFVIPATLYSVQLNG